MSEPKGRGLVDVVADAVIEMADRSTLSDDAKLVVLAALDGDDALATVLADNRGYGSTMDRGSGGVSAEEPVGAFLSAIEVRGFRGIGPTAKLAVRPAPGLTIVAGRNGSGKSTFSDALEVALTGDTYRWRKKKSKMWKEHWRNVHDGTPCRIRVELAEEGAGATTVGVDWADSAALADRTTWTQRRGKPREPGIRGLGWSRAVQLYQPILSYDELGGVLDEGPSTLFDKLDAILGIEQATDAEKRMAAALKEMKAADTEARAQARSLKQALAGLTDERARRAHDHLRKRHTDLDAVEAIATGTASEPARELTRLKALTQLGLPRREDVVIVAQALREAHKTFAETALVSIDIATRRAGLLRETLSFHDHRGDVRCPVCGVGQLDATWRARVLDELGTDDEEIDRHHRSRERLARAREEARRVVASVPPPVRSGSVVLDEFAGARQAHQRWSSPPEHDEEFAAHLETVYDELDLAFGLLRQEAETVLARHEEEWAPHAIALANWVGTARKARKAESAVRNAEAAHEFVMAAVEQLRARELTRLTDTAKQIWAALKQESNVNLGSIALKGTSTRRRVELRTDVDGAEAGALGVMSQGELHALALALFLPRATMPGSPFRFVVLDDPIQAMDPSKVDGFVRVLATLASDHQVVVFSHDDRLPQAVRQLGVDAEILEVYRHGNSSVEVTSCLDPARRYLEDAFAVANDPNVPVDVVARVIPGLCRMAVEAAAHETYLARRFTAGDRRTDVEVAWESATTTRQCLALVVEDDPRADLTRWLDAKPWRRHGLRVMTKGAHEGLRGDPLDGIRAVERIVTDLRARAW